MKLRKACADAEKLSIKHKEEEFFVIIGSISKKGIDRYEIATKDQLLHWKNLYVIIKSYQNGKELEKVSSV